jgi:TRAP transporter TAXI family solute receptor
VARLSGSVSRRSLLTLPAAALPAMLLPACGMAWAQSDKSTAATRPLVLGTSTPGGGFALYGSTLERVLNQRAGRTVLQAKPTRGTTENLTLLAHGDIDAALIQGTAASEIFQQGSANRLRILFAMYPSPGMLAVPATSAARKFEDLLGQRVVFGVRTSGLVTLARQVFTGIGLDIDHDFDAIYVEQAAESPRLVLAGVAAGLWGAGEGWPGFTQLANAPSGARFIGPSSVQIKRIVERYPQLTAMEVAAGAYPGIDKPLPTVGSVNFILVRDDLDASRATAFIEAMRGASNELAAALPQAAFSTLANTVASAPSRDLLHPAVLAIR